jgi:hypothetical protein
VRFTAHTQRIQRRPSKCQLITPQNPHSTDAAAGHFDFKVLHAQLTHHEGYRQEGVQQLPAEQVTPDWLQRSGVQRPVIVSAGPSVQQVLGIKLAADVLTTERIAAQLGPAIEVQTLDVAQQCEGPRWTLHQWSLYWRMRRAAHKVRRSISIT